MSVRDVDSGGILQNLVWVDGGAGDAAGMRNGEYRTRRHHALRRTTHFCHKKHRDREIAGNRIMSRLFIRGFGQEADKRAYIAMGVVRDHEWFKSPPSREEAETGRRSSGAAIYYRGQAGRMLALSASSPFADTRALFLELARQYEELAERADRRPEPEQRGPVIVNGPIPFRRPRDRR